MNLKKLNKEVGNADKIWRRGRIFAKYFTKTSQNIYSCVPESSLTGCIVNTHSERTCSQHGERRPSVSFGTGLLGGRVQVRRDGCGDVQGDLVQIKEGEKASSSDQNVSSHHRVRV